MEKERKITAPEGCEIEKVEIVDGVAVVTFKKKERKLPKSWEEFCEMYKVSDKEFYFDDTCNICNAIENKVSAARYPKDDQNLLPDRATAEAVLALCQLIQLRNAFNGDWVPDWKNGDEIKHIIQFSEEEVCYDSWMRVSTSLLYFKTAELREEFLRYFRPLIEKLKPLYGIKEGGQND